MREAVSQGSSRGRVSRRTEMRTPESVGNAGTEGAWVGLVAHRGGARLLAEHREALAGGGGWRAPSSAARAKALDDLEDWVSERFRQHAGNADVVRQELAAEKGTTAAFALWSGRSRRCGRSSGRKRGRRSLRDTSRPAVADRLRRALGGDRRYEGEGVLLRGHSRSFPAPTCAGLLRQAPGPLVRRHGRRFPPLRRRTTLQAATKPGAEARGLWFWRVWPTLGAFRTTAKEKVAIIDLSVFSDLAGIDLGAMEDQSTALKPGQTEVSTNLFASDEGVSTSVSGNALRGSSRRIAPRVPSWAHRGV
ncbi:hypothetical protein SAMN05444340_11923 [Citreimonas salinaria]|uniref:Uncharacterized protein n=1 Tax=Citreimonas salinaria TaxID=321339 RepID=A0A1H3MXM3_9RHOB|nr:hypothetical protein SAMN05444340_11923 [Citreimonas salinaria]